MIVYFVMTRKELARMMIIMEVNALLWWTLTLLHPSVVLILETWSAQLTCSAYSASIISIELSTFLDASF